MKLRTMWLALASCLFAASAASALTFVTTTSVDSGRALDLLQTGDVVTINIRMSNPAAVAIFGIGAGAQGWDNSVAEFVSAELGLGKYFCPTATCNTGLDNGVTYPNADENTGNWLVGPGDIQNVAGVGSYFPIVQAISTTGRAGNGARDPGLDGVVNGNDAQFRIVFRAGAPGTTTINIGTNANPTLGNVVVLAGGVTEQAVNSLISLTVVPEPGTALLMGLGLAGLAAAGRRQ